MDPGVESRELLCGAATPGNVPLGYQVHQVEVSGLAEVLQRRVQQAARHQIRVWYLPKELNQSHGVSPQSSLQHELYQASSGPFCTKQELLKPAGTAPAQGRQSRFSDRPPSSGLLRPGTCHMPGLFQCGFCPGNAWIAAGRVGKRLANVPAVGHAA